jgi:transcriptional regulator with XRE-family HTH domain
MNANQLFTECVKNIPSNLNGKLEMSLRISDKIDLYLKQNNMNQKDLAERMNKRPSEISKWMRGTHNFTIYTLYDIAQVLNIRITDLLE